MPLTLMLIVATTAVSHPTPKYPIGKETTYITEPLDKDGYVDYEAALNSWLSQGIVPEKNSVVLLPDYYYPVVSRRTKNGSHLLIDSRFPTASRPRVAANALIIRAMLALEERRPDAAWDDLLTCHRLGRLVGRGPTGIEALIGNAIEQMAIDGALVYLDRARPSAEKIRACLKDLRDLPPTLPWADAVALGERVSFLDYIQLTYRGGTEAIAKMIDLELWGQRIRKLDFDRPDAPKLRKVSDSEKDALAQLDWEAVLRTFNRRYNTLLAVVRVGDRSAREKEFDRVKKESDDKKPALESLLAILGQGDFGKRAGELFGEILGESQFVPIRRTQESFDRREQARRNLHVAFALALYHREYGFYPKNLGELTPKYLPLVPTDLFSGQALIYRIADQGYLLYSVGKNGVDDGGQASLFDRPPGDDLGVRMPLPELKKD